MSQPPSQTHTDSGAKQDDRNTAPDHQPSNQDDSSRSNTPERELELAVQSLKGHIRLVSFNPTHQRFPPRSGAARQEEFERRRRETEMRKETEQAHDQDKPAEPQTGDTMQEKME